jgi:predicted Zn-dependent protease
MRFVMFLMLALSCCGVRAVTQEEVMAGADRLYRERLDEARRHNRLDGNPALLARLTRIAAPLIAQAARDYPGTAHWRWEIHTTADADENAFCMAGGKLLIGQAFVAGLGLDDAELAMLLSHEMQHALLQHNRKEYEEAMRIEPAFRQQPFAALEYAVDHDADLIAGLAGFNRLQEIEADREGLKLAWRAGWPAGRLARYFRKMMRASAYPNAERAGYPAPSLRWRNARELARQLDTGSAP